MRELHREHYLAPLSPTELIHEIWLRNLSRATWKIRDQGHFYAIASLAMRRILTDLARKRLTMRRNAEPTIPLNGKLSENAWDTDARKVVEIGVVMERLEAEFPDAARVVDMHYFAGFTFDEIAKMTELTLRQVRVRWEKGMKWLRQAHNGNSCD
jgi:RNA polymerase sigma factor (TIGR02999 family)